jgi:hypothetical protein
VQLIYIARQLGQADVSVTARHYAKWAGGDEYLEPLTLEVGEVPADFLARLVESHQNPVTLDEHPIGNDGASLIRDGA